MYAAEDLNHANPAYALQLIDAAWDHRLALYTGAGLSRGEPSKIPDGAEVARRLHRQLASRLGADALAGAQPDDLLSVVDTVAAMANGSDVVRSVAVQVAEFTTAAPNFGHRVIAHLLLEDVVVAITTNWDDCIERGGSSTRERLLAVISDQDRQDIRRTALLKVHGCATKPATTLVTSADLGSPPAWARDELNARLADSHTVFVGIGDIAAYVAARIAEAKAAVGASGSLFVVSPGIRSNWKNSPWSSILPDLDEDRRIAATADEFLDHLAAAYVLRVFSEIERAVADQPRPRDAVDRSRRAFVQQSSLDALQWVRSCAVPPVPGQSVMRTAAFSQAMIALGVIAGSDDLEVRSGGVMCVRDESYELLVGVEVVGVGAPTFRREAEVRHAQRRERGEALDNSPTFLIAGALGRLRSDGGLPSDILDPFDSIDVVSGPLAGSLAFVHAEDVAA